MEEAKSRIQTSKMNGLNAETLSEEDVTAEQKIIYDIIVTVRLDREQELDQDVHLIFDLEMQRTFRPGYPIMNRIVYYLSRLIAQQPIKNAAYEKILSVRSTWISIKDVPKELQNRVFSYKLIPFENGDQLVEKHESPVLYRGADLITADLILLSEDYDWNSDDTTLVKFLQAIFNNRLENEEFNPYITSSSEIREELSEMIGGIDEYEREWEYGMKQAEERGEERGVEKKLTEAVGQMKAKGFPDSLIAECLNIQESEIEKYLKK